MDMKAPFEQVPRDTERDIGSSTSTLEWPCTASKYSNPTVTSRYILIWLGLSVAVEVDS